MATTSAQANTKLSAIKNHFVPSVVTSAMALMVAIPLTAALSSGSGIVSASPILTEACSGAAVSSAVESPATHAVAPATFVDHVVTHTEGSNNNNSGAQNNGNTAINNGLVGVNAFTAINALNNSLNNNHILSDNEVNLLSGNTISAPVSIPAVVSLLP